MWVWIVLGRRPGGEPYIVGVFWREEHATETAERWRMHHADGTVTVERWAVLNGRGEP